MSFELRHENIKSDSLPILDNDVVGEAEKSPLPHGWDAMPEGYEIGDGRLKDALYESRDIAARAVANLFSEIGVEKELYGHVYDMPVGLIDDPDYIKDAGSYDPGIYAIMLGKESKDVCELGGLLSSETFSEEDFAEKVKRRIADSMAHEMVHSVQTVPDCYGIDGFFGTIGDTMMGWHGLEEGMTEALGNIAMKMHLKNMSLSAVSEDLEERCKKEQMPATQLSARMVRKMSPELLKWYLSCAQTGSYKGENKLQSALDGDYAVFLKNLNRLYKIEVEDQQMEPSDTKIIQQMEKIIDEKMAQQH